MTSHNCRPNHQQKSNADPHAIENLVGANSERFDAPDEAEGPGFLGSEAGVPDGENLRALIDAFETFLGFGNRFNWRDPELFGRKPVESNANALRAIFHPETRRGERPADTQIRVTSRCFNVAIGHSRARTMTIHLDLHRYALF